MKAAIQMGVGKYEIRDVPVPEITPTQCLIKVGACTICATDAKYFKGLQKRDWPSRMGHEITGTIAKVGSKVMGFREGDRILSRVMKLDDIMEAFDLYIHQNEKHIKIAIAP